MKALKMLSRLIKGEILGHRITIQARIFLKVKRKWMNINNVGIYLKL